MLKYEGFGVGDRIKAFHFEPCPGRPDSFLVGVIIGKVERPYAAYVVAVERNEVGGKPVPVGLAPESLVPMQALHDFEGRVSIAED